MGGGGGGGGGDFMSQRRPSTAESRRSDAQTVHTMNSNVYSDLGKVFGGVSKYERNARLANWRNL